MRNNKSGSSLVAVLITVCAVSAMLAVVTNVTRFQARNGNRTMLRAQAVSYGDAVLESLFDQWRYAMVNTAVVDDRTYGVSNATLAATLTTPTTTQLPPPTGISIATWSVTARTPLLAPTTRADGRPDPEQGTNSRLRVRVYYTAHVEVNCVGIGAGTADKVVLERSFVRGGRNVFDNFFFGTQKETEIHPGAPMYLDGKVYAGGNLYTAHNDLKFLTDVSFLGTHTLNYRTNDPRYGNAPTITSGGLTDNWSVNNPPRQGNEQKLFDTRVDLLDPKFMNDPIADDIDSDGNKNNDGYHELIEEAVAGSDPLQLDPDSSERLSKNADYRIYVNAANVVTIYKGASTTALATTSAEYVAIKGALTTNTALKDIREADNVRTITMDVGLVKTAHDTGKIVDSVGSDDGLLFYVADTSVGTLVTTAVKNSATGVSLPVTSSAKRGVKLVNGAKLPTVGMTVASPNIVYIQGDYNTGKTASTQPASNTAASYTPPNDKPSPVVSGYNRVAAAVAGDAVNILSNAWNDANSLTDSSTRVASSTTVNTAVIAGNVPTVGNTSYSGGVENFTRFHENWAGKYFTIYGTLALLYNSQQATRPWESADYSPPNRRWYYDTNLQEANPPGFRVARVYERGRWTLR
jgi:hypothetical protein